MQEKKNAHERLGSRNGFLTKPGTQESSQEAITRLGSSFVLLNFSSRPCCFPTALS